MGLLIGIGLVVSLGVGHHFALIGLRQITAQARERPHRSIISVFVGLVAIHLTEILLFAGAYHVLLTWNSVGTLAGHDSGWQDLVYFSGINFTTLGYTRLEAQGPIRMVSMMQSLGGFMVLTWSATFIYTVWKRAQDGF
ncbi:ion channel [Roseovarius halotolerans]|uniref:Potassium channel domain-containing protein n=1 Tax=Roseovarius halotolerans TaxID=505353 RepID=A0A1X6YWX5_9RHOB|nr:ion channel [Roseovarius halotolerans]RKT32777.1 ion channel [Roseovarius halotolerans]SLN33047.1 hypothetical protein ROH8110_01579 [Roseovarius halotolerans]